MKKLYYLIILTVILSLVLTGCFLSNVGQVPTSEQSGIAYLTKNPSPSNLVGLWHFDVDALDSSGNDNYGTVYGATYSGQALSFDGTNDYVQIANESNFDFERTNPFSFEAWIKPSTGHNWFAIVGKSTRSNSYRGIRFMVMPTGELLGELISTWSTNVLRETTSEANVDDGNWHHVVMAYDGTSSASGLKFYVDGSEKTTTVNNDTLSATILTDVNLKIGASTAGTSDTPSNYFNGLIDEVRIWNTASPSFNLTLNPDTAFNPVNTEHTVTATVTIDKVGGETEPAPGVLVDFTVSGANFASYSDYTNSDGVATFAYTGSAAGEDTIIARINEAPYAYVSDEVTKDWVVNFVTGGGNIKAGKKTAWNFAGTVGYLPDMTLVGQFQIVDHTNKFAYHLNSFSSLVFSGTDAPAESPVATYDTATFTGSGRDKKGNQVTIKVIIKDLGEPGAGVDRISIDIEVDGYDVDNQFISGGNFQVHEGYKSP
jgi:hypothetical protein